jgi:serine phosphatase RsbU (regulator of sigma subunit)
VFANDFGAALRLARGADPASITEVLGRAARALRPTDMVVYLIDFGQTVLEPFPDRSAHPELPKAEDVATTLAGRCFRDQCVVTTQRDDGTRVFAPVVEGSDRTGVLALTVPTADDTTLTACEELGLFAGYLIAAQARCTDTYNLHRRRRSMSLAASMQWDLLPPLVMTAGSVSIAGLLEPAYDVGGDCFDYAMNGPVFDFAIMDAMGHGVGSAVIASLAMGSYRHDRREGRTLEVMHRNLSSTISSYYRDGSFSTGVLGRLDVATGLLSWTNAGHPLPLLIRGGRVVKQLVCPPTPPWGTIDRNPTVATEPLEPDDFVLLYTDGVSEAPTHKGEQFGVERLIDLVDRYASELARPQQILQALLHAVRTHIKGDPRDDATFVLLKWAGPAENYQAP